MAQNKYPKSYAHMATMVDWRVKYLAERLAKVDGITMGLLVTKALLAYLDMKGAVYDEGEIDEFGNRILFPSHRKQKPNRVDLI